jgi:Zn-dependent protease with chaperone function
MDFFGAEQRAKTRTARLLVLFSAAVGCTVLAGYASAVIITHVASAGSRARYHGYYYSGDGPGPLNWWQPGLLLAVCVGTAAVILLASLYKWSQMAMGGSAVAQSVGGRRVDPGSRDPRERQLLNVVEEMAIAAGLPVPAVFVIEEEPGINAFAAGLTTSDAAVTVTRGTMEKLTRDELQGVIGHEFSHILNGDMRMNMRVSAIIFGILVIGLSGRAILWGLRGARVDSRGKGNGGLVLILAIGVALLVVGYAGYFFGRLIQASISRQREFLADASSVQFTRNPGGITGALKKIGAYAIGSRMDTHRAAEIGHFFFASALESHLFGSLDTHPPLSERIRAIEPAFDGTFPEVPEVVDVAHKPWSAIPAMARAKPAAPAVAATALAGALAAAATAISPQARADAGTLLSGLAPALVSAARSPHDAPYLVFGLLLDADPGIRRRQTSAIAARHGSDALHILDTLDGALSALRPEQRLPLLQLALPALKSIPPTALGAFADTLDDLVQADGRVSAFEYALQRLVLRELATHRDPKSAVAQVFSFQAVAAEISTVLSCLAHASSADATQAAAAFAAGAGQLKLVQSRLEFLDDAHSGLAQLDAALETLATASGPIKQRVLVASAQVVAADGVVLEEEAELLRAIGAALDVPVPPFSGMP